MDPLTRCARIPVDLTMSGRSEAMKMFHVSIGARPAPKTQDSKFFIFE